MSAQHTPGIWSIQQEDDGDYSVWASAPVTRLLATCHAEDMDIENPAKANALAIAAVPELIGALYQYRNDLRYPPAADSVERRLAMIEALLAKIGGEA